MTKTPAQCLEERGWLTLSQFVEYVREVDPVKSLSYPAMLRYVNRGMLTVEKVGGQRRIIRESIEHYLKYGVESAYKASEPTVVIEPSQPVITTSNSEEGAQMPSSAGSDILSRVVIPPLPESKAKRPIAPPPPED